MPLPEQIKRQQKISDDYDAALAKPVEEPKPTPEPTPPAEPPAPEPQPSPQPAPAPAPATPPVNEEAALWKQRFLSLQGMFNSQVPALQKQVKDLAAELEKAKEILATVNKTSSEPSKDGALVTDTDVQAFGGDLVDMVKRAARQETAQLRTDYEKKIADLTAELAAARQGVGEVAQAQATNAEQTFFEKLDLRVPKWEEIQASPEAQRFLSARVPGTANTWNDVLTGAASRRDLDAVVEVFDTLFSQFPKLNPRAPATPPAQPTETQQAARTELERQVAPPKSAPSGSRPPTETKRVYSQKDYADESMKVVRLVQQGKEKEALALEAELDAALKEGRVKV